MHGRTCWQGSCDYEWVVSPAVCWYLNHNLKNISPCDHEEADTRMLLHVRDTLLYGSHTEQLIRTNDSDVLVLAVSSITRVKHVKRALICFWNMTTISIWYIAAHQIARQHALTGSDTTFVFHGHGKKSAWNIWQQYPEVNSASTQLSSS